VCSSDLTCQALALDYAPVAELEPALALEVALIAGTVTAFADFPRDQGGAPWKIPAGDWQHLTIRTLSRWRGTTVVVDLRRWGGLHSTSDEGVMINLRFDRETVMAAFPASSATDGEPGSHLRLVAVAAPVPTSGGPNVPMGGLSLGRWIADPQSDAVARERVKAAGGDHNDEPTLRVELEKMLQEMGKNYAPGSIGAKRRAAGFKARDD
jgi:hypothetical protein